MTRPASSTGPNLFPICDGCNKRRPKKHPEGGLLDPACGQSVEAKLEQRIVDRPGDERGPYFAARDTVDRAAVNTAAELDHIHNDHAIKAADLRSAIMTPRGSVVPRASRWPRPGGRGWRRRSRPRARRSAARVGRGGRACRGPRRRAGARAGRRGQEGARNSSCSAGLAVQERSERRAIARTWSSSSTQGEADQRGVLGVVGGERVGGDAARVEVTRQPASQHRWCHLAHGLAVARPRRCPPSCRSSPGPGPAGPARRRSARARRPRRAWASPRRRRGWRGRWLSSRCLGMVSSFSRPAAMSATWLGPVSPSLSTLGLWAARRSTICLKVVAGEQAVDEGEQAGSDGAPVDDTAGAEQVEAAERWPAGSTCAGCKSSRGCGSR
jgi:hypothetical protein